ncbi:MAG: hypothetical protein IKL92_01060 [Oscillospiraceae bacterium]|nr:hypothetical protein [Oscillospiraceae bacterium]
MLCPKCKMAAQIRSAKTRVENDDTPDKKTVVYLIQEFVCRNSRCEMNGKAVGEVKHQIY